MTNETLHEPFHIEFKTLDESPVAAHKNSFFELVYIRSGTGKQCINGSNFKYAAGHMFLITPEDCHSFEAITTTEFFFLRFNDIYLRNKTSGQQHVERLEFILQNANHQPGCILRNLPDKTLVQPMVEAIAREYANRDLFNQELVHQLVQTMIVLVARNIARLLPAQVNAATEEKALDILQYIQSNIYFPEKLKADVVSKKFGISQVYLGRYFKKHTNETMQVYIIRYKTKLIEHRLKFSDKRINEIAGEFGFTDESHLNKFFRKQNGSSPRAYRNLVRN